jgi:hypothetical protein
MGDEICFVQETRCKNLLTAHDKLYQVHSSNSKICAFLHESFIFYVKSCFRGEAEGGEKTSQIVLNKIIHMFVSFIILFLF